MNTTQGKTTIFIIVFVIALAGGLWGSFSADEGQTPTQQPADQQKREVSLFYYDSQQDTNEQGNVMCSEAGLVPVKRTITEVQTPVTSTVELLLDGNITSAEEQRGLTTEFPLEGFTLEGVNIADGLTTLEFSDPQFSSSGGSCRVTILRQQIEKTVLQFDVVSEVRIVPEGILQP